MGHPYGEIDVGLKLNLGFGLGCKRAANGRPPHLAKTRYGAPIDFLLFDFLPFGLGLVVVVQGLIDELEADHQEPEGEGEAELAVGDAGGYSAAG
jgi:hypothetical protein